MLAALLLAACPLLPPPPAPPRAAAIPRSPLTLVRPVVDVDVTGFPLDGWYRPVVGGRLYRVRAGVIDTIEHGKHLYLFEQPQPVDFPDCDSRTAPRPIRMEVRRE